MATPTLVQKAGNSSVYPAGPIKAVLPVAATAGNCLIIAIQGVKLTDPFSVSQMAAGATRIDNSTLVTPAPVVTDNLSNTFTAIESLVNFNGELSNYCSLYLYYAANIAGGNQTFTVTNVDATGRPTFNSGLSVQVYEFSGVATTPIDGHSSASSSANPAVSTSITTSTAADLIFISAFLRKTGELTLPTGYTLLDSNRVAGTGNDYYINGWVNGNLTTASATITNIAIATNVLTATATNTFQTNAVVTFSGLTTNTFLNGQTVTVTNSTGTTFTAAFTHANVTSVADTGTAVGGPANIAAGATQPGLVNPSQYKAGIAVLALKHS